MGVFYSKHKRRKQSKTNAEQDVGDVKEENENEQVLRKLRDQYEHDIGTFILNNLLLSVQFFENFDREINELRKHNVSKKEIDINLKLKDLQKHCLIPDTLHDIVNKHVLVRPEHGSAKYISEPLRPSRIIIVHDNIEILDPLDSNEYSIPLDGPTYRCEMEDTKYKGYVELILKEVTPITPKYTPMVMNSDTTDNINRPIESNSSISEEISPGKVFLNEIQQRMSEFPKPTYKTLSVANSTRRRASTLTPTEELISKIKNNTGMKNTTVFKPNLMRLINEEEYQHATPMRNLLPLNGHESPDDESDSDYGYSKIDENFTPKPLEELRGGDVETNAIDLPPHCVTNIHIKVIKFEEPNTEELMLKYPKKNDPRRKQKILIPNLFEVKKYMNSNAFSADFADKFILHLATPLGFDLEETQKSLMHTAIIHSIKEHDFLRHHFETIPSTAAPWPIAAFEWPIRKRHIHYDEKTKKKCVWPTPLMINKIIKMHCHVLPIGYIPKRGKNPNHMLHWQLTFPAAERFLETWCLKHEQIRCYLFALVIYKTFAELTDTKLGLNVDHIRTHLFWECEDNFVSWNDNQLGEKLIIFLKHLTNSLKYFKLPDYFISGRNLFGNIPNKDLLKANRKLHDILENPVIHIIYALRNLRYVGDFYPVLDYKELYTIITSPNIYKELNPTLKMLPDEEYESDDSDEFIKNDKEFWQLQGEVDPMVQWKKRVREQINEEKKQAQKKSKKTGRVSVDSINLKMKIYPQMEEIRKISILNFFITHFISMAIKSNEFEAISQGVMYLTHAKHLITILGEQPSAKEDAQEHKAQIKKLADVLNTASDVNKQKKSQGLTRNSSEIIFNNPIKRNNIINEQINTVNELDNKSSINANTDVITKKKEATNSESHKNDSSSTFTNENMFTKKSPNVISKLNNNENCIPIIRNKNINTQIKDDTKITTNSTNEITEIVKENRNNLNSINKFDVIVDSHQPMEIKKTKNKKVIELVKTKNGENLSHDELSFLSESTDF